MKKYDIVIIGNYTKDTIVSPTGTRMVDGGGFNYGAHAAVISGLKVATVTRLAMEDARVVDALVKIGVDALPHYTPHSTELELYYPTSNVDERIISIKNYAGAITPDQVDDLQAEAFIINSSVRGEVDLDVIETIRRKRTILAADVQGFLRVITDDKKLMNAEWEEKDQVLSQIDILKTDAVEAEALTGEKDIKLAAKKISAWGVKEIVLTHKDGLLVYANDKFYETKFYPEKLIGRSGRGDTCLGSYIAKRLSADPEQAMIWAAAITSLKMEAEGPIRRKIEDVENLIRKKYIPD